MTTDPLAPVERLLDDAVNTLDRHELWSPEHLAEAREAVRLLLDVARKAVDEHAGGTEHALLAFARGLEEK